MYNRFCYPHAFYILPHDSGGLLWYWLSMFPSVIRVSFRISFLDDILSKFQWIFTKLGMCIDIAEIWFGIVHGQILSIFDRVIFLRHVHIHTFFRFSTIM